MNIFFILQIVLLLIQICSLFMECYYFIVKDLNLEKESLQKEIASLKNNISEANETFNLLYHKAENRAYFNSKEELTPVELEELIDNAIYIGKMIGKAEETAEKLEHIEHKLKILNKN